MIIEKQPYILIADNDPEIVKLKDHIINLLNKYPYLKDFIYVVNTEKISKNSQALDMIKSLSKIATGEEKAILPIYAIDVHAYTNNINEFISACKYLNFTNKKKGSIFIFLAVVDPEIEYQMSLLNNYLDEIYDLVRKQEIFMVFKIVGYNDREDHEKVEQYVRAINKKIYGEEGLKLPVFAILYTYSTTNITEFEYFLDKINNLNT